jgi:hypothetical protein
VAPDPLRPLDDIEPRCAICGWPLAESVEKGCVMGNCSQRPWPARFYDPERADREYGHEVSDRQLPLPTIELENRRLREQISALESELAALRAQPLPSPWQPIVEDIASYVEHLRDEYLSTMEPVSKVARLIRERFAAAPLPPAGDAPKASS